MAKENFSDRLAKAVTRTIGVVSPERALRRQQAQLNRQVLEGIDTDRFKNLISGYYRDNRKGRTLGQWKTDEGDANAAITDNLTQLRNDSNNLYTNNAVANGVVNTQVTNVVGTGLELHATIDRTFLNMSEEQAEEWEVIVEREFEMFSLTADMSLGSKWPDLEDLVFRSVLLNGDILCNLVIEDRQDKGIVYETGINLIEGQRLSNPDNKQDTVTRIMGIDIDENGAPLKYNIRSEHPGQATSSGKVTWSSLDVFGKESGRKQVLHIFRKLRVNQLRGVPVLAPFIESIKKIDTFTQAEIDAAIIQAFFTVFITKATSGDSAIDVVSKLSDELGSRTADKDIKMGAANIVTLGQDEKVEFGDPKAPHAEYDNFVKSIIMQVGMGLGIPNEVLIKEFKSSYSASRGAIIEAWKLFYTLRDWLAREFCQPVYEAMLFEGVAKGRINAPGYLVDPLVRAAYSKAEWIGPEQGELDPMKSAQASALNMKNYVSNHFIEAGRRGRKFEKLLAGVGRAKAMIEELGLPFLQEPDTIEPDQEDQQSNKGD